MSDIAIRVENLSKQYEIDSAKRRHDTLRDLLAYGLKTVFSRNGAHRQRKLTGRENIYLNGAILGMKKAEIDRNFDAIIPAAPTPLRRFMPTGRQSITENVTNIRVQWHTVQP